MTNTNQAVETQSKLSPQEIESHRQIFNDLTSTSFTATVPEAEVGKMYRVSFCSKDLKTVFRVTAVWPDGTSTLEPVQSLSARRFSMDLF